MRRILTHLGEDATYTPSGGGATSTVRGLFQQPYQGALGIESSGPTFSCMTSDTPGLKRGATFVLRSTTYTVAAVHDDQISGVVIALLHT